MQTAEVAGRNAAHWMMVDRVHHRKQARALHSRCAARGARDPRIERVIEALREPESDRAALVRASGVSLARLQALFARDVGVPIRRYQLWWRLMTAVIALRRDDATTAAHAAGFADLAHFSRTCRRLLGYTPSAFRRGVLGLP